MYVVVGKPHYTHVIVILKIKNRKKSINISLNKTDEFCVSMPTLKNERKLF